MTKFYKTKSIHTCFCTSKKPLGLGIMIDTKPPYAVKQPLFVFEIRLIWLKFWLIKE